MEIDIFGAVSSAYNFFLQSAFFHYLKIFSAFVSVLLFIDVILLLSKRVQTDVMIALYGCQSSRFKKSKYIQRWEAIKKPPGSGKHRRRKNRHDRSRQMLDEAAGKIGIH